MTAVLLLPSLPLMTSCQTGFYYDHAAKYTAGNASFSADTIDALDVDWFSGEVLVEFGDSSESEVSVSETANKKTDEDTSLHYWLDGTTLKIKFAASGKLNLSGIEKTLKVTLPRQKTLLHLSISGGAANVNVKNARADKLTVSAVAGSIELSGMRVSNKASISSTSGNISGSAMTACDTLNISSTSGSISFSTEARVRSLGVETTSGNIRLSNLNPAKKAEVETVSGNVELDFLDNSGFSVAYNTVSGKFSTDFKMYLSGDKYVYGTPNSDFSVKTAAGNLTILSIPT